MPSTLSPPQSSSDRVTPLRYDGVHVLRRLTVALQKAAADEVSCVRDARAIVPSAAHQISAVDGRERAHRRRTMWRDEMSVLAEQLDLRLLRPMRCDLEGVRRRETNAPADAGMAARDLRHGPVESREIELVTAEHPRLGAAVEPGLDEILVQFLGIGPALVVLVLLSAQLRPQRRGARDHLRRREPGFGLRNCRRRCTRRRGRSSGVLCAQGRIGPVGHRLILHTLHTVRLTPARRP